MASESFFKIQKFCVRVFGHRYSYWDENNRYLSKIIPLFNIVAIFLCVMAEFKFTFEHLNNIKLGTLAIPPSLTGCMTLVKSFSFLIKKNKFMKLNELLQEMYDKSEYEYITCNQKYLFNMVSHKFNLSAINLEERLLIDMANARYQAFSKIYLTASICTGLYYIIYPLAEANYLLRFSTTVETIDWPLPMKAS